MKIYRLVIVFSFSFISMNSAFSQSEKRIYSLYKKLDSLKFQIEGLNKTVDFNVSDIELPSFIRAVGKARKVNLSVSSELQNIVLTHNFSNATVKDVLLYLCREHQLTFDVTGNIISLKRFIPKPKKKKRFIRREIFVDFDPINNLFSLDLQNDTLSVAFKKITNVTGKNLVFSPKLSDRRISGYIQNKSFESAMDKLAFSNDLIVTKTQDNYYLFEAASAFNNQKVVGQDQGSFQNTTTRPSRYRSSNFFFAVIDIEDKTLEVDFQNTSISSVIMDIGNELGINTFTNTPLENIGIASVKADKISYDELLTKILEDTPYTYKKKNDIYYFGKQKQTSLRSSVVIPLMHRSIEIMSKPMRSNRRNFNVGYNSVSSSYNNNRNSYENNGRDYTNNQQSSFNNSRNIDTSTNQTFGDYQTRSEALVNILPREVIKDLEIKTDLEHNAFIVSGGAQRIEQFKEFISKIDKPVPVVLIEVMILEVSKSATVSAGIDLGLGDQPAIDKGILFSSTDVTFGAKTINKIIGGFNGFGSLNVGKVVPNFFARIKMMEDNGNIKIRSTPKLSTLNGHKATLSNGERSYYKIERTDVIGSQNPQTVKTNNYIPIDADLTIGIRPIVSGDEQITLSISVLQSTFNGKRIDVNAPPGMNSREFTSTIRVRDQDVIILGGLEENVKNDSGSGVPLLSRIPVIKWLFSKKTRTDSKTKLSVLIKPTIIR